MKYVETERLILRAWRDDDLAPFARMNADPLVREYFPSLLSKEESDASVAMMQHLIDKNGFCFWAAELKESGQFIGMVGLNLVNAAFPFAPAVEVGWRIAQEFWGKGYATEGALACLDYGFNELKLDEIVAFTVPSNMKSRNVMHKIGMHHVPEKDFDHPMVQAGNPCLKHVFYVIKKELAQNHNLS